MRYSPFRHIDAVFWKQRPIHLTFFVTRRCNARCPFCFYLSHDEVGGSRELTVEEVERISASMGTLLWLAFSGGEVFLRDDIVEITRVFYEKNRPAVILLPTNGLLTDVIRKRTEEILSGCRRSTVVVKLSLEGPEDIHDAVRGTRGAFRKTMQTYEALAPLLGEYDNFELGVNTVFLSKNQDHMDELIDFVSRLDRITTHTVSLIRGDVPDRTLKDIDTGKYLDTIQKVELYLKSRKSPIYRFKGSRLKAAQDIVQRTLIHDTMVQDRQIIPCFAGRLNLVLTESGDVFPCESFSKRMGNLRDHHYSMERLLRSEQAQRVVRSIRDNGCFCTHECYFMTNILFNPRLYPSLLKQYIQL